MVESHINGAWLMMVGLVNDGLVNDSHYGDLWLASYLIIWVHPMMGATFGFNPVLNRSVGCAPGGLILKLRGCCLVMSRRGVAMGNRQSQWQCRHRTTRFGDGKRLTSATISEWDR